jgi:hypothetical protein
MVAKGKGRLDKGTQDIRGYRPPPVLTRRRAHGFQAFPTELIERHQTALKDRFEQCLLGPEMVLDGREVSLRLVFRAPVTSMSVRSLSSKSSVLQLPLEKKFNDSVFNNGSRLVL